MGQICPKCGGSYLAYDAVEKKAVCRRMFCDFEERVEGREDFKEKFK